MWWHDALRIAAISLAGATYGLAAANLIVSHRVLRPKRLTRKALFGSGEGFLWLHIICVVVAFQGFVAWGVIEVITRIHEPLTWRFFALLFLCSLISVGYLIIYRIELTRLRLKKVTGGP